jgi:nicotinamidase-related amidase
MSAAMLLVMDMLNDLVHEDGSGAKTYVPLMKERGVLARTRAVIDKARKAGALIGYVRVGFSADYRECPPNSPIFSRAKGAGLFKLGTWGTEVHPDVAPQASDFDIVKHRVSPFYGTSLEPILRGHEVKELYLCGVSTNGVVHSGAREAHDRDYACTVIEDCCAGATADEHDGALRCLGRYAAIKTSADVAFT